MSIGPCAWIWPLRVNVVPWHCAEVPATTTQAACDVPIGRPFAVTSAVKVIVLPAEMPSAGTCIEVTVWMTVKVVALSASLTAALSLTTPKSRAAAMAAAALRMLRRMAPPCGRGWLADHVV